MSNFSKNGIEKAMDSAAKVAIDRFMARETHENLRKMREQIESGALNLHVQAGNA